MFKLDDPGLKFEKTRSGPRTNIPVTNIMIPNAKLENSASNNNIDLTKIIR